MKHPALRSRYRKSRGFLDYDYAQNLTPADLDYLEAFTASFYNGTPSDHPGSIGADESAELNAERRRDLFTAGTRVDGDLSQITENPPYRSDFSQARRKQRRKTA